MYDIVEVRHGVITYIIMVTPPYSENSKTLLWGPCGLPTSSLVNSQGLQEVIP